MGRHHRNMEAGAPRNLRPDESKPKGGVLDTIVTLTWEEPAEGAVSIQDGGGYEIELINVAKRIRGGHQISHVPTKDALTRTCAINSLKPNAEYEFRVRAYYPSDKHKPLNSRGEDNPWSATCKVRTRDSADCMWIDDQSGLGDFGKFEAKHRTQKQVNPNNGKGTEEEGVCKVCAVM